MKTPKTTYSLMLEALDDDSRPAITRLRQLLKFSLRALRLRCVTVQEVQETGQARSEQISESGLTKP